MTTDTITIRQPDDWHLHLRDGQLTKLVLSYSAEKFGRALIMPNLTPPVETPNQAIAYKKRILSHLPTGSRFQPLMTLFLTEKTRPEDVREGILNQAITAVKLYPSGATTNSLEGVKDCHSIDKVLEVLCEFGIPLCVHGEVSDPQVDIFDREAVFIDKVLIPIRQRFPQLKIVIEHITTQQAVEYVQSEGPCTAATITVHHLFINRNHMFKGGIRPHYYCLPVAKREEHRLSLLKAIQSLNPKFFLGTDSAPHTKETKESACGCAGMFTAPIALEAITQIFDNLQILDQLENFTSVNGSQFYGLPLNEGKVTLSKSKTPVKFLNSVVRDHLEVMVFNPEVPINWKVESIQNE